VDGVWRTNPEAFNIKELTSDGNFGRVATSESIWWEKLTLQIFFETLSQDSLGSKIHLWKENSKGKGEKYENKKTKLRIKETPIFFDKHNKRGNIIEKNKNKNLKTFF